jgi:hypothetical protein
MIAWLIALAALIICVSTSLKITKMTLNPYSTGSMKTKKQLDHVVDIGVLTIVFVTAWLLIKLA